MEWIVCETLPFANRPGATYGLLKVEAFDERVERFCQRWDCVGACYFDAAPPTAVTRDEMFDYDEGTNYTIGGGKADVSFTSMSVPLLSGLKYLQTKNHSDTPLHFAYCTTSRCRCEICQEWLKFETIPLVDTPGWTVGQIIVEPAQSKIDRFCVQWDCIGACFLGAWPAAITKSMLFDYDETRDYTIAGGKAELCFTHQKPQPAAQSVKSNDSSTGKSALAAGLGAVGMLSDAYKGASLAYDVFDGPDNGDFADSIGDSIGSIADAVGDTAGELLGEVCVIS